MSDTQNNWKLVSLPREIYKDEPELTLKSIFDDLGLQDTYDNAITGQGELCMTVALTDEEGQKLTATGKVRVEEYYELSTGTLEITEEREAVTIPGMTP